MLTLNVFRRRREEFKAKAAATFGEFAALAAADKDIDMNALTRLLVVSGRSMSEFEAEAERLASRPAARAMIDEADKMEPLFEAAAKKAAGLQETEEQVRRQCEQAMSKARSNASVACEEMSSIQRRIAQLRSDGRELLLATCDPKLEDEIVRLESRARVLTDQHCNGRQRLDEDPKELAKARESHNAEIASIQTRIEELRAAQVAV